MDCFKEVFFIFFYSPDSSNILQYSDGLRKSLSAITSFLDHLIIKSC